MNSWLSLALSALALANTARGAAEPLPATNGPASAEEVERLKKQNAELQQRLDKIAGELDEIKTQLGEKPGLSSSAASAKNNARSGLELELYGYVKLDMAYDNSRVSLGDYARWVESEQINPNDNEFNFTANETRIGVRIHGPDTETFHTLGVIEADFYGGGAENSPNPRLRLAYINFEWPEAGFGVLAGQAKDTISPLFQPRVNFSPGWWQGNIDFRRPQLRLTQRFKFGEGLELKVEAAAARTIAPAFAAPKDFFPDPGADAGFPTMQGRVSFTFPGFAKRPATIGVSGHWGEDEHDFTNYTQSVRFKTWSANVDLTLPLTAWLTFQGEAYVGENLDAYLGGIGQGVNATLLRPIGDRGGWAALTFGPFGRWVFNLGYGIDDVEKNDLAGTFNPATDPRARNQVAFGNVYFSLTRNLQIALEEAYMRTDYKSVHYGDDWRTQLAFIYKF